MDEYRFAKQLYTGGRRLFFHHEKYLANHGWDRFELLGQILEKNYVDCSGQGVLQITDKYAELAVHLQDKYTKLRNYFTHHREFQGLKQMCLSDVKIVVQPNCHISISEFHNYVPGQSPLNLDSRFHELLDAIAKWLECDTLRDPELYYVHEYEGFRRPVRRPVFKLIIEWTSFRWLLRKNTDILNQELHRFNKDDRAKRITFLNGDKLLTQTRIPVGFSALIDEIEDSEYEIDLGVRPVEHPFSWNIIRRILNLEAFDYMNFDAFRLHQRDVSDVVKYLQIPVYIDFFERLHDVCSNKISNDVRLR